MDDDLTTPDSHLSGGTDPLHAGMPRRRFIRSAATASLALLAACRRHTSIVEPPEDLPEVAPPRPRERAHELFVGTERLTIEEGRTIRLRALASTSANGTRHPVRARWTTSDGALGTIDDTGLLQLAPGAEGELEVESSWDGKVARMRVRAVPRSSASQDARELVERLGGESVSLLLDARTGLALGDDGTIHQWQDARGPGHGAAIPFGAPPVLGSGPDGRPTVLFDGVAQGLRTSERFTMDSTVAAPSVVYIGTTWGGGIAAMLARDGATASGMGISLEADATRAFARDGRVVPFANGVEGPLANGPGDRSKSRKVRLHEVGHWRNVLYARSPLAAHMPASIPVGSGDGPLLIGRSPAGQFNADAVSAVLVMPIRPSTRAMDELLAWARDRHGSVAKSPRLAVFAGDSLVNGLDLPDIRWSFPSQLMERPAFRDWDDVVIARGGTGVHQQLATAAFDVDPLHDAGREKNVFVLMTGTNDLAVLERTGAQAYADTRTYCLGRRAQGWRVVVLSMVARKANARFERERQEYLTLLRNDHAFADAFVDVAADPRFGAPEAWADPRWFSDGVHLTREGYAVVADMLEPVLLAT